MAKTEILIVGAGAIGAFYASRLVTVPEVSVSAVCRSNYSAVKTSGFKVTSPWYEENVWRPTRVFANADEIRASGVQWDFILICTKALPELGDDSAMLEGVVGDNTTIVVIQNGLGVERPYAVRFPSNTLVSAVTIASASQPAPGMIQHHRWTRLSIGPYLPHTNPGALRSPFDARDRDDRIAARRAKALVELFTAGGIRDAEALTHGGLQAARWHKVAVNAAFNPLSILAGGVPNREMAVHPSLGLAVRAIVDEVLETAPKVLGAALPSKYPTTDQIMASATRNQSGSKSSMLLDWEARRPLELEAIVGNPLRAARQKGVVMPRLELVYALAKTAQESRDAADPGSKL